MFQIWTSVLNKNMELAWRSGSVMYCHATARGSIPCGNGVNGPGCRL